MSFKPLFYSFSRLNIKRSFYLQSIKLQISNNVKYAEKVFSGIQPTGSVHLGNYLGAIKRWKQFQDENARVIYSIVDLHSITLPQDPNELFNNVLQMTATLLACGIDPKKSLIFQQSCVPQHTELCWQLGCLSTMARLAHLPQYKEKSAALKDVPLGLFVYPVLQAADILAYKATHVPVGEDQAQHLALAQDLARMFNNRYGETFPVPHSVVYKTDLGRLKSLRDPTKKMSKSDPDPKSRISLTDSPDEIVKKFKKAVTDFTSEVYYDPEKRPGVSNIISIHSSISGKSIEEVCNNAKDLNTGRYKIVVADEVISHLAPLRTEITLLLKNVDYLLGVLECGAEQAKELAEITIQEVRVKLGLRSRFSDKSRIEYSKIK